MFTAIDVKDSISYMRCHCSVFVLQTVSCKNIFYHITYSEKMRSE